MYSVQEVGLVLRFGISQGGDFVHAARVEVNGEDKPNSGR